MDVSFADGSGLSGGDWQWEQEDVQVLGQVGEVAGSGGCRCWGQVARETRKRKERLEEREMAVLFLLILFLLRESYHQFTPFIFHSLFLTIIITWTEGDRV